MEGPPCPQRSRAWPTCQSATGPTSPSNAPSTRPSTINLYLDPSQIPFGPGTAAHRIDALAVLVDGALLEEQSTGLGVCRDEGSPNDPTRMRVRLPPHRFAQMITTERLLEAWTARGNRHMVPFHLPRLRPYFLARLTGPGDDLRVDPTGSVTALLALTTLPGLLSGRCPASSSSCTPQPAGCCARPLTPLSASKALVRVVDSLRGFHGTALELAPVTCAILIRADRPAERAAVLASA